MPYWPTTAFAQSSNKSWTDSISSGFKKIGNTLNPSSKPITDPEDDPTSLRSKKKPSADLYVSLAHVYEQAGKTADAEAQYKLALAENPNHLQALLGYAQLNDTVGKTEVAVEHYKKAIKAHPQEASPYNNLGLSFARQNRLDDAVALLNRAVQLSPKNALYRNNIATILVDQEKYPEALQHLSAVHTTAVAHYNMGYLLNKKGKNTLALQQFQLAVNADPTMEAAQRWAGYLQKTTAQDRVRPYPIAAGVKVISAPPSYQDSAPLPPYRTVAAAPSGLTMPTAYAQQPATDYPQPPAKIACAPLPPPKATAMSPSGLAMPTAYAQQATTGTPQSPPKIESAPLPPCNMTASRSTMPKAPVSLLGVQEPAPLPPLNATGGPQRLPPAALLQPDGVNLPGISYNTADAPMAPLPPTSADSAVRTLPKTK